MAKLDFAQLSSQKDLLEQLQEACLLVSPDDTIELANRHVRRLLNRRVMGERARDIFGAGFHDEFCAPLLKGELDLRRWRETSLPIDDAGGGAVDIAATSMAVRFDDGRLGALVLLQDISVEVSLHKKYKELIEEQRQVNQRLQKEIAKELREHEDDISQFSEILQLGPTIFASFVSEANDALASVDALVVHGPSRERLELARRAMHTLKGNSRSLGLNLIGGRAHALEDILDRPLPPAGRAAEDHPLTEILQDLRRAIERALAIRQRLGELTAQSASSGAEIVVYELVSSLEHGINAALSNVAPGHPAHGPLSAARRAIAERGRIPLRPLFEYLRIMVSRLGGSSPGGPPIVDTDDAGLSISPALYGALSEALPHLLRNAFVHGIESSEERRAKGKTPVGTIALRAEKQGAQLVVYVTDDGRGLDFERLRQIARARQLPAPESPRDFAELLFLPGVSTAEALTKDAGRGVGTSASKDAIERVGGRIEIKPERAVGTEFVITLPVPA